MGKGTKRKKNFYTNLRKKKTRSKMTMDGTIGYLGTCTNHEDLAIRECYSFLNEFADKLYGKELSGK